MERARPVSDLVSTLAKSLRDLPGEIALGQKTGEGGAILEGTRDSSRQVQRPDDSYRNERRDDGQHGRPHGDDMPKDIGFSAPTARLQVVPGIGV